MTKLRLCHPPWRLTPEEQKELADILPRAGSVTHVRIGRQYGTNRWVVFQDLPPLRALRRHLFKTRLQK